MTPGFAIWFTGLPASGKSTLAQALQKKLAAQGIHTQLLDSDRLRQQLTPNPTYSSEERDWFYDTIGFLAALLAGNGVNVLIAATAPRRAHRDAARERLARFAEVFVDCPPAVCRQRDPKGLWRRADAGEIDTLPGAGIPYERPLRPEATVNSSELSVDAATTAIYQQLNAKNFWPAP